MKIAEINGQRVLTPENSKWLYNAKANVISNLVYLGILADENEWTEITDEYKQELEAIWYENIASSDIATPEDYENALAEFGVTI